jgi:hypothetical protein
MPEKILIPYRECGPIGKRERRERRGNGGSVEEIQRNVFL